MAMGDIAHGKENIVSIQLKHYPGIKHPVLALEPDNTFDTLQQLMDWLYEERAGQTQETSPWMWTPVEFTIGPNLYRYGYQVNTPFRPCDMFEVYGQFCTNDPYARFYILNMEEGGMDFLWEGEGEWHYAHQTEEEWATIEPTNESCTFNPYTMIALHSDSRIIRATFGSGAAAHMLW